MTCHEELRADAQRNRDKILDAAEEVFAAEGVGVPIDVVAERAGVGIGTLYRHFPTKEALFEEIVATRMDALLATAEDYVNDSLRDPAGAFSSFIAELARQAAAKQDLFEALERSGLDFKATFSARVDRLVACIDVLRVRAVEAGAIRADITSQDVVALVMGTCHAAFAPGSDDQALARCVGIVIAGLRSV